MFTNDFTQTKFKFLLKHFFNLPGGGNFDAELKGGASESFNEKTFEQNVLGKNIFISACTYKYTF